jgi:hypothetical protein
MENNQTLDKKEPYETEDGKVVRLNEVAFRLASRHFGVRKFRQQALKEKPIELLKIKPKAVVPAITPPVEIKKTTVKKAPVKKTAGAKKRSK